MFKIDDSYLEDEVRDGFYIPSISKRAFAAELSLLHELNRICDKYDIKYFADWGTLIGTIRHRGFIPWDDDMDVCMHRNDLEKLLAVVDKELTDGFEIHSFENNDYSWKFIYNLVNTERMCFEPEYLKTHYNFPYMATIDIFVLDNVSDDEEYEEKRRSDVRYILEVADITTDENLKSQVYIDKLNYVEQLRGIHIDYKLPAIEVKRILYRVVQNILKEQNHVYTQSIAQMIPWGIYHKGYIPREYYEEYIKLPFENTTIRVPRKYYSLFLNYKYGSFWEIKIGVGGHGYPYFKAQKESLGTDIDYVPHYKFNADQLIKDKSAKDNSIKAIASEYSEYLKIAYNDILETVKSINNLANNDTNEQAESVHSIVADNSNLADILSNCQENAIQFGTLVEKVKGENTKTVSYLEKYCELLFNISQASGAEDNLSSAAKTDVAVIVENDLKACTDSILSNIDSEITSRRTVVFLPFKGEYFDSILPYYNEEIQKADTDVYVVPLPYYYKEYNGTFKEEPQYDLSAYPKTINLYDKNQGKAGLNDSKNMNLYDYNQIDLGLLYPDAIYIQNPYDEFNMAISVPNYFYASNLKNLTDELIYIPWFKTSDFDADNYPQNYNMQYYCIVPGVVLSDKVYVSSETIRERYIEKLTEFSGEEYKEIWEGKVKVSLFGKKPDSDFNNLSRSDSNRVDTDCNCKQSDESDDNKQKKYICFYTSPSQILEFKDKYFDKINSCINIFNESAEKISVIWHIESYELEIIKSNDAECYNKLSEIIESVNKSDNIMVEYNMTESEITEKCDAFYGDGAYLSKDFVIAKKPVMIMDMNVL